MKKLFLIVLATFTSLALAFFHPGMPRGETEVQVPVTCTQVSEGQCLQWGAITRGCKAPAGGSCTATVKEGEKTATCNAKDGGSCNARITLYPEGTPQDQQRVGPNPLEVKVPALCTQQEMGKCVAWSAIVRGCKAPASGGCRVNVELGNQKDTCLATNGLTCNARLALGPGDKR